MPEWSRRPPTPTLQGALGKKWCAENMLRAHPASTCQWEPTHGLWGTAAGPGSFLVTVSWQALSRGGRPHSGPGSPAAPTQPFHLGASYKPDRKGPIVKLRVSSHYDISIQMPVK